MTDSAGSASTSSRSEAGEGTTARRRSFRRDGQASRERIVQTALRLFASQGFARTSTRQIAQAANVNVAAIHYHFGDKAALYRAAFMGPEDMACLAHQNAAQFDQPGTTLEQAMHRLFSDFLAPLGLGEEVQWMLKLHFRELVEPTGLWQEEIDNEFKPMHAAMVGLLCRELDCPLPDDDVHRLAFATLGMAVNFFVAHDVISQITPPLLRDARAVQQLADRLATYTCDLIHAEAARRRARAASAAPPAVASPQC